MPKSQKSSLYRLKMKERSWSLISSLEPQKVGQRRRVYKSNVARMAYFDFILLQELAPMTSTRDAHRKQSWRR